ncbi:MAG: hypothetical protein A3G34_04485 [Candidatus Lindowbacteria bacterium RIFCSPLOWO2_12_FULL_62_27]|nr:MAG: hypothetical protein A3I06_04245 [Candidatus Lindowbacteria bacterium RIFCSPLOWO2_02_FULL_62_12]OGH57420.1 MAG: hypothetical protein A3G34_04485 [Candidatus Lindowbacteria bacterium RIFCSPLOWO2_12_FULL_62_27]
MEFGNFKLIRELGHGGMGAVYLAERPGGGNAVALKILPEHFTKNETFIMRFRRECDLMRRLDHPGIPRLCDEGEAGGRRYLAMEYVPGLSLEQYLADAQGRVSPEKALEVLGGVARILSYAHRQGVIHRDVSAKNILLGDGGEMKLIDFGIAKLADDITLTVTGQHLGTPSYMAPEQFSGAGTKAVGAQADLWSLGVIGFQLLTGRLPFEGETPMTVIRHIIDPAVWTPPVLDVNPSAPPALAAVVDRLLQKDPLHRYPTADDLVQALALSASEQQPRETYDPKRRYGLDDIVYLPRLQRWAVVDEEGTLKKSTYVGLIHHGGQRSRRACRIKKYEKSDSPCAECGGSAATEGFCPACGLIAPQNESLCRPGMTRHLRGRRRTRIRTLSMAVASASVLLLAGWSVLSWSRRQTSTEDPATGLFKKADSGRFGKVDGLVLDVNAATFEDLVKIKNMGADRALFLLAYRHRHGAYKDLTDVEWALKLSRDYGREETISHLTVQSPTSAPPDSEFLKRYKRVNINQAGMDELMSIPFVGDKLAQKFLERRGTSGPFRSLEDVLGSRTALVRNAKLTAWLDFISLGDPALDRALEQEVDEYYAGTWQTGRQTSNRDIRDVRGQLDLNHAPLQDLKRQIDSSWWAMYVLMSRHKRGSFQSVDSLMDRMNKYYVSSGSKTWEKMAVKYRRVLYVTPGDRTVTVDSGFLKDWGQPLNLKSAAEERIQAIPFLKKPEKEAVLAARKIGSLRSPDDLRKLMTQENSAEMRFQILRDFVTVK